MRTAIHIGISISEYEEITPYELNIAIEEHAKRKELESKERITLAYLNARWTIQWLGKKKDQPRPLNEILGHKKEKKVMTDEQMLQQVKLLNTLFGGEEITSAD